MKPRVLWIAASLLSILFASLHVVHDVALGIDGGGLSMINVVVAMVVWLYATLVLAERRSGYAIVLVLSLFVTLFPVVHMTGRSGISAGIKESGEALFFAWTLIALGATGLLSTILSAQGLWSLRRGKPRPAAQEG